MNLSPLSLSKITRKNAHKIKKDTAFFLALVSLYRKNEAGNAHSKNRELIARFFAHYEDYLLVKCFVEIHDSLGYTTTNEVFRAVADEINSRLWADIVMQSNHCGVSLA